MEPEGSSPQSQVPATCPYLQPARSKKFKYEGKFISKIPLRWYFQYNNFVSVWGLSSCCIYNVQFMTLVSTIQVFLWNWKTIVAFIEFHTPTNALLYIIKY